MDGDIQVIACLVIDSRDTIVCQCGFQVFEEPKIDTFRSSDGGAFKFVHSTSQVLCDLNVSYFESGTLLAQRSLVVPVNRSKIKWKHCDLYGRYTVHYRCQLEDWCTGSLRKKLNRIRRGTAVRGPALAKALGGRGEY